MATPENKQPFTEIPPIEAGVLDPSAEGSVRRIAATALTGAGALYLGTKGFEGSGAEAIAAAPIAKEAAQRGKEAIANTADSAAIATIGLRKFIAARRLKRAEKRAQELDEEDDIVPNIAKNNWTNSPPIGPDHPHSPATKRELSVAHKIGRTKTRTYKRQAEIRRLERVQDVDTDYKKKKRAEKKMLNANVVYLTGENGRPNLGTGVDSFTGKAKNIYTPPPPEKEYVGSKEHAKHIAEGRMLPSERKSHKKAYRSARRKRGEGIIGALNPRSLPRDSRRATKYFDPEAIKRQTERADNKIAKRANRVKSLDERQKQRREQIERRRQAARARKTG